MPAATPPTPGASSYIKDKNLTYEVTPLAVDLPTVAPIRYAPTSATGFADTFTSDTATPYRVAILNELDMDPAQAVDLSPSLADAFVLPPKVATV